MGNESSKSKQKSESVSIQKKKQRKTTSCFDGFQARNISVKQRRSSSTAKENAAGISTRTRSQGSHSSDEGGFEEYTRGLSRASIEREKQSTTSKSNSIIVSETEEGVDQDSEDMKPEFHSSEESRQFKKYDRVVWRNEGRPKLGTFKWIGRVEGVLCAGLELTEKKSVTFLGHTGSRRFSCKHGHRALVPIDQVMLYQEYINQMEEKDTQGESKESERGIAITEGPTLVEPKSLPVASNITEYQSNSVPQGENWRVGDIIWFPETEEQAEIIRIDFINSQIWTAIKFDTGNLEQYLLRDVMAAADVIIPAKVKEVKAMRQSRTEELNRKSENDPLPSLASRLAKLHNAGITDRSFSEDREDHHSSRSSTSRSRDDSGSGSNDDPPERIPSPPPKQQPVVSVISQHQEEMSPIPRATLSKKLFAEPDINLQKIPRVKENNSKEIVSSTATQNPINVESGVRRRPRKVESEPDVKYINTDQDVPPSSRSESALTRPGSGGTGIDEVDVSLSSIGFNRNEELKYAQDWSKTHRKSQRQAAHKGVEAIFKKQVKASSVKASERETNAFGLDKNDLIADVAEIKSNLELASGDIPTPDDPGVQPQPNIVLPDEPPGVQPEPTNILEDQPGNLEPSPVKVLEVPVPQENPDQGAAVESLTTDSGQLTPPRKTSLNNDELLLSPTLVKEVQSGLNESDSAGRIAAELDFLAKMPPKLFRTPIPRAAASENQFF